MGWFLIITVLLLGLLVQVMLKLRFARYSKNPLGMSGAQIAERMLRSYGIDDVRIECIQGQLTDHYDPRIRTVNLSHDVYYGCNVAAAAVACHECGHVLQHADGYAPLRLRTSLVPAVTFASNVVQWVLLAGVLLISVLPNLIWVGIGLYALTTLFSFVTLPVEVNASRRAVAWLRNEHITDAATTPMAADALKWAAYTYVCAALGSLFTLLYYIGIARSR